MSDRTIFFLVFILIICGIYTYDQYKVGQGETSPIATFMDYTGLVKYINKKEERVEISKEKFYFDSLAGVKTLKVLYDDLRKKRKKLVAKRVAILEKLYLMNETTIQESMIYINLLTKEKEKVLTRFSKATGMANSLLKAHKQKDVATQQEYLKRMESEVQGIFGVASSSQMDAFPAIVTVKGIKQVINREKGFANNVCYNSKADGSLSDEEVNRCLEGRINILDKQIQQYVQYLQKLSNEFEKIRKFTEGLKHEHQILEENSIATEARLANGVIKIEEGFKFLVEDLIEVTDKDMKKFLSIYSEFQKIQDALIQNLSNNQNRFMDNYKMTHLRIQRIVENVVEISQFDFSKFQEKYDASEAKREELLKDLFYNEKKIFLSNYDRRKETRSFVENFIRMVQSTNPLPQ